jgi:hypothetical protein
MRRARMEEVKEFNPIGYRNIDVFEIWYILQSLFALFLPFYPSFSTERNKEKRK